MLKMRFQHILFQFNLRIRSDMLHITATTNAKMRTHRLHANLGSVAQQFKTVGFFEFLNFSGNTGTHGFTRQGITDKDFLAMFMLRMIWM